MDADYGDTGRVMRLHPKTSPMRQDSSLELILPAPKQLWGRGNICLDSASEPKLLAGPFPKQRFGALITQQTGDVLAECIGLRGVAFGVGAKQSAGGGVADQAVQVQAVTV